MNLRACFICNNPLPPHINKCNITCGGKCAKEHKKRKKADCVKKWRENNKKRVAANMKAWFENNKERRKAWCENNKGVLSARSRARKQHIVVRSFLHERKQVEAIYAEARRVTKETGIPHCVDHKVPLVHNDVCGLHVVANLRVLISSKNDSKGNKWDEEYGT